MSTKSATECKTAIDVSGVVKRFGQGQASVLALKDVSLSIRDNEFFTLLGPSGCGKTTLLRILAGFEAVSDGTVALYGENIAGLPANRRSVNTVFQHYALFPHMTVAENVAYGPQRLRRPPQEISETVARMLQLVKMEKFAERRPTQLSGGQQQRVALARALAPHPKVLLLDEPLSALDLKLRQAMRAELKQLQRATGITFVFVTHDQEEALSMSDRIAVMSDGEVQQVGTPSEIYEYPVNRFVASFIGDANFIAAEIAGVAAGVATCRSAGGLPFTVAVAAGGTPGDKVTLFLRPEKVRIGSPEGEGLPGRIMTTEYLGQSTFFQVDIGEDAPLMVAGRSRDDGGVRHMAGDRVSLAIGTDALRMLVG
ncbi:ABC transporter ATP-binding protein [Nordella sp. HKS 07]|uniref:ABC transporter ATP-binding protein n=1 Tax=Nordella sp. HKS 07 TaxID=2712222 RepID=UPI0013E1641C|nr:ABC transporter ATP-binding protein [Nordella sp. HKS 07]QIG51876.1 ABC transporter ATP-binding protein [Nordella sp. HKS 07]